MKTPLKTPKKPGKFKDVLKEFKEIVEKTEFTTSNHRSILRQLTRGFYDIQKLRIAIGNRLCANFYSKLNIEQKPKGNEDDKDPLGWGKNILLYYVDEFMRLADFVSTNHRNLKKVLGEHGGVIGSKAEYALVQSYINFSQQEGFLEKQLADYLENFPIWSDFMKGVSGVGALMGSVIISEYDIYKARYVSSMWAYAGLDVIDGEGRSRKEHHLVDKDYIDRNGDPKTKKGISFNPFLKTKLLGVLAPQFVMQHKRKENKYGHLYYDYKNRLVRRREGLIADNLKTMSLADAEKTAKEIWPDGRIHNASNRYIVKMFIKDLYPVWKELEGLEVMLPYEEKVLGMDTSHHK